MIKNKTQYVAFLLIFVSFTGCSQMPVQTATEKAVVTPVSKKIITNKERNWSMRLRELTRKVSWNLNSKVAVTFQDEHWPFGLDWVQQGQHNYVMNMKNPLTGALVAKLTRDRSGVSLLSNNGRTYRSHDEEQLLKSQSGISLPLKGMKHWVRGVSSPLYKVDKLVLDNVGRPQALYQAGWKISYSKYTNNSYKALPRKIFISRVKDDLKVKMIVKRWQGI